MTDVLIQKELYFVSTVKPQISKMELHSGFWDRKSNLNYRLFASAYLAVKWQEIFWILESEKVSKYTHFRANLVEFRAEKVLFCLYHTALWLKCKILYQIAKIKVCKSTPSLGLLAYFQKLL